MKLHDKDKVKLLERALISVYRKEKEEEIRVSAGWQSRLMRHIRQLGPSIAKAALNSETLFNRLVWRFAAAASLVCLILVIFFFSFARGIIPEYDLVTTFMDDPDSLIISQP